MNTVQRKEAAILGALVGDAASLGFHWLYDPQRLHEIGGDRPEFHTPNPLDYEGASGYFAADGKRAGDQSHYGAQLLCALTSLHQCEGKWNPFHYQSVFCQTFDRGGSFQGYIDTATAGTLDRVCESNERLLQEALSQVEGLTDSQQSFLKKYVVKKGVLHTGDELVEAVAGMAELVYKEAEVPDKARAVARYYDQHRTARCGADDNQLPATAKLPVVVSFFAGKPDFREGVEEAIRVTNDNEEAVTYGLYAAEVLQAVILGREIGDALKSALDTLPTENRAWERIKEALQHSTEDLAALGRAFGPACPLPSAIPVGVALLKEEPDYLTGIRRNILVSGDNAGRATWLGAVLGARYGIGGRRGIPTSWMAKLTELNSILSSLSCLA